MLRERHKKAQLEFAKTYPNKPESFSENVNWMNSMFTGVKKTSKKNNMEKVHLCLGFALLLLVLETLNLCVAS